MNQVTKKYDITQCAFYKCSSKKRLSKLLEIDIKELKKVQNIISYHKFSIKKKNTKEKRNISEPQYELKKFKSAFYLCCSVLSDQIGLCRVKRVKVTKIMEWLM